MSKKEFRFYIFTAAANIIVAFSGGAIIQSFLTFIGLNAKQVGIYSFCVSAVQGGIFFVSSFCADRIKNIPRTIAILNLPALIFFGIMIFLNMSDKVDANQAFMAAIVACCLWNLFYGFRVIIEYKLPYCVADASEYPRVMNISGIIACVCGTMVAGAFAFFSGIFDYKMVILICFIISALFVVIAFFSVFSLENKIQAIEKNDFFGILKLKATRYFILPNIIRGCATGIIGMAAVIMLSTVTQDVSVSSSLTAVNCLAGIFGCLFYVKMYRRIKAVKLALFAAAIEFIGLLFMLSGNSVLFIIMYFIACFGHLIIDYFVPIYVAEIIPYDYMGSFTAMRMLFFNAGLAVGSYIVGTLVTYSPFMLVVICGILQILHIISYVLYEKYFRYR